MGADARMGRGDSPILGTSNNLNSKKHIKYHDTDGMAIAAKAVLAAVGGMRTALISGFPRGSLSAGLPIFPAAPPRSPYRAIVLEALDHDI